VSFRFKVQLVVMADDQEVCVDDVVVLDKQHKRLEHIGLSLTEAKNAADGTAASGGDPPDRCIPGQASRVPERFADRALANLSPTFDAIYCAAERPSIPPERLLTASFLISLYSVRSERAFCAQLDYDLLWRWFLERLLKRLRLPDYKFHELRHTAASLAIAEGASLFHDSRMLGHSSISITADIYGHIDEGREDIASRMGRALFGCGSSL
jgi:hypothetical protein